MYTFLRLENFKSWVDTGLLRLRPITALFGTNSSGKTSLLQALLLLKQTVESSDRRIPLYFGNQASLVNLGDFQSIVSDHDTKRHVTMRVTWSEPASLELPRVDGVVRAASEPQNLSFTTSTRLDNDGHRMSGVVDHFVVDTNVPLAANDAASHATIACRRKCVTRLLAIQLGHRIVLDSCRLIIKEYLKNKPHGTPQGPGDAFMIWALENSANPERCLTAHLTPINGQNVNSDRNADDPKFEEFPDDPALANFDPKDRKFVAAAIASGVDPIILNATDSDWRNHEAQLGKHGVRLEHLCLEAG